MVMVLPMASRTKIKMDSASFETAAYLTDTDEDGIADGIEDVNLDGLRQEDESDPRLIDTDFDGLGCHRRCES